MEDAKRTVTFDYIKSNLFRVIHADGVWGGIAPTGKIHLSFFNDDNVKLFADDLRDLLRAFDTPVATQPAVPLAN